MTAQEVVKFAKENGCQMVDYKFLDFVGIWQHFTQPISEFSEETFEEGIGFDGSSIRGWQPIHNSDMLIVPDPKSAKIDPFPAAPTLHRVLTACDGEEAVEVFRRNAGEIAIAVLDVVMPKMGGKQAYDRMLPSAPGLKVLFLSGYSADAIHDSFVLRPGIPFLQKPYGLGTLARKVREVLDRK